MSTARESLDARTELIGNFSITGGVSYLADVQLWEPHVTISRLDGKANPFVVPCGPECYRKNSTEALNVGWVMARLWLDGGKIPWHARSPDG
jgi:hypothetical protein